MKTSIKTELEEHILDCLNEGILCNSEDWHYHCFNEDYYIIGYYEANKWLEKHNMSAFEAIDIVREYEVDNFGEFTTEINSESIVNMLVYIYGAEIIYSLKSENVKELKNELETNNNNNIKQ